MADVSGAPPVLWWVRRDLRLADNATLIAAIATGQPVLPVYVLDNADQSMGAAPRFRLGLALEALARRLEEKGSRLILRRGEPGEVLPTLLAEVGASTLYAARSCNRDEIARDLALEAELQKQGASLVWHSTRMLFDPWTVATQSGTPFRVYTPFWRAVRVRDVPAPMAAPSRIPTPDNWPESDELHDWGLGVAMNRGADVVARYCEVGEEAALDRLDRFISEKSAAYAAERDRPDRGGTSGLSAHLAWGELSPARAWHAGQAAMAQGRPGAETFLKQLVWREFATHLMYHTPHILSENWHKGWDSFPWETEESDKVLAWKQGRTGIDFVDAAMRELYVTGAMHNRARMVVASFLCKHLMVHWKIGMDWFSQCLVDWDRANNAMGWQWVAGCGPDAAPFFRIFNPERQGETHDPDRVYVNRWLAEGQRNPPQSALDFFDAIPRSWDMAPTDLRPQPVVDLKEGRARALEAYKNRS